jgi:UDP-GlcNAc3NAcA epimerase
VKVFTVVGNRPQFIKSAPLSAALRDARVEEVVLHTGQHWYHTLSQVFFDQLGLAEPRYRLDLHTSDTDTMQPAIAERVVTEAPDLVLVYGDTNSTLSGARAAADASVPLAHVEAGLRSGDLDMPEEHNRIETDRLSWLLFCPDDRSRMILEKESVLGRIYVVGDVMADATRLFGPIARAAFPVPHEPHTYVVTTIHRQANVEQPRLGRIVDGLNRIDELVVFPVHPRTRARMKA